MKVRANSKMLLKRSCCICDKKFVRGDIVELSITQRGSKLYFHRKCVQGEKR